MSLVQVANDLLGAELALLGPNAHRSTVFHQDVLFGYSQSGFGTIRTDLGTIALHNIQNITSIFVLWFLIKSFDFGTIVLNVLNNLKRQDSLEFEHWIPNLMDHWTHWRSQH